MHLSEKIKNRWLNPELRFSTARSGGAGGQHVNKVKSKVSLHFDIAASSILSPTEKNWLLTKLKNKIDSAGCLHVHTDTHRSQFQNKELAIKKFYTILKKAFYTAKPRLATKPTKAANDRRLLLKKLHSEKKALRKKYNEN